MATRGRPPKTDVERRPCLKKGHSRRRVVLDGVVRNSSGVITHQRYRCAPGTKNEHRFAVKLAVPEAPAAVGVAIEDEEAPVPARVRRLAPARPWVPPEPCPEHPGSKVVRQGVYKAGGKTRQRYLCTPLGWYPEATRENDRAHVKHRFTPVLPRAHVEGDDACPHCAELRAVHRGETAVARKHSANTRQVAEALAMLGRGQTYTEVAQWLQLEVRGSDRLSPEPRNAWRRAADIVEVFAPVLWDDWLSSVLREDAQRAADDPSRPRIVLLDDLPLYKRATRQRTQDQRFVVIAAAEAVPVKQPRGAKGSKASRQPRTREVQLRLLRALPTRSTGAYTLVLDDLVTTFGFVPDIVVADGGKGIKPAVDALARRTGHDILFATSTHHLRSQLGRAVDKARGAKQGFDPGSLAVDLEALRPFTDRVAFEAWFDAYLRRLTAQGVPRSGWPNKWRNDYYDDVCTQLDGLAPFPDVPRSTGALETLLTRYVKPTMKRRAQALGNIARTQQLLDLIVLHSVGYFHDLARATTALREDSSSGPAEVRGFAPPVRTMADPGLYRSLTDEDVITDLMRQRGLA